jgi:hypothetical protein
MKTGIKHLIECHCTLKIYQKSEKTIYHKFPVYSKYDAESGRIVKKIAQCNNCKTLHNVYDICKSELIPGGKDVDKTIISKEDIVVQLPSKIGNFLTGQDCDITIFEHVLDIIDNEAWGENIVLTREIINEETHVKILQIISENKFKIKKEVINNQFIIGG